MVFFLKNYLQYNFKHEKALTYITKNSREYITDYRNLRTYISKKFKQMTVTLDCTYSPHCDIENVAAHRAGDRHVTETFAGYYH